jgi:pyruvate/2-oxoglutarate dehydrogenase complex dihydrolipoamide acyltransferase (E2) component
MGNRLEVYVPKMGMDTTEVVLSNWLVQPGTEVAIGTPLVDLESEKVTFTLECEYAGRIVALLRTAGTTVPVGAALCVVETR